MFIIIDKSEKYIEKILNNLGADVSNLQKQLRSSLSLLKKSKQENKIDKSITKLIDIARHLIFKNGDKVITQEILLLSLTCVNNPGKKFYLMKA